MADITANWRLWQGSQSGLSVGVDLTLPSGAVWRRLRIMPFNVGSVEAPRPEQCQIWPRFFTASGQPSE